MVRYKVGDLVVIKDNWGSWGKKIDIYPGVVYKVVDAKFPREAIGIEYAKDPRGYWNVAVDELMLYDQVNNDDIWE